MSHVTNVVSGWKWRLDTVYTVLVRFDIINQSKDLNVQMFQISYYSVSILKYNFNPSLENTQTRVGLNIYYSQVSVVSGTTEIAAAFTPGHLSNRAHLETQVQV